MFNSEKLSGAKAESAVAATPANGVRVPATTRSTRRGFSALPLAMLILAGISVAPSLSAAAKSTRRATAAHGKSEQKAKFKGTLLSITQDGTNIQLTLSGGITMTLPQKATSVVDERTHKATPSNATQLAANMQVTIKTHMDKTGKVTEAKIKIQQPGR
jgi:hypothetical protein